LSLHLDGARLMNAVIATRRSAADLAAPFDTVSLCLSKGLGAPIGSVLSGPRDFIRKARRNRKMAGGGMRQAGVLAACGLHALDHHVERLAQDHANAKRLAQALSAIPGLVVDYPANATNMVWVTLPDGAFAPLQKAMAEQGILLLGGGNAMRIVAHLDVTEDDMTCVADAMAAYFGAG
ncbi:MAG TPA: beta-eliminating lyase-related protein, partial [Rhizobiaceae bacterium]|nr:beta-eliminating lyase-related protein [Rhizobiaceae bacterium]